MGCWLMEQVLVKDNCEKGVYFKTNLEDTLVRRSMGQADLKKENDDAFLSPEVDVNIANLVNEVNDFAVGILRAEMRAVEESARGCFNRCTAAVWRDYRTWKASSLW